MTQRAVAGGTDWRIEDIATAIGEHIHAWRVVLFGSQARGDARDDSDYDLYVEADVSRASLADAENEIRKLLSTRGDLELDLHLHPPGAIEDRSNDPGTIEWDVAREGVLLYARPGAPRLSAPATHVSEPARSPPPSMAEWLAAASEDMEVALLSVGAGTWRSVCYHVQQTCEKRMKALLVSRGIRPPRSHQLEVLVNRLREVGCELPGLREDWTLLSSYSVTGRYPERRIDEVEARAAVAAAERVAAAVLAAMS